MNLDDVNSAKSLMAHYLGHGYFDHVNVVPGNPPLIHIHLPGENTVEQYEGLILTFMRSNIEMAYLHNEEPFHDLWLPIADKQAVLSIARLAGRQSAGRTILEINHASHAPEVTAEFAAAAITRIRDMVKEQGADTILARLERKAKPPVSAR
jgi:hypothetical protein